MCSKESILCCEDSEPLKKPIPVSNKCSLSVPHQRLVFVTSLFYEQLMHLLPKMGKAQLRRMPLVQSFIYQCFSVFGGWICWRSSGKTTSLFQSKKYRPITKHSRHLCFMVLHNELIKYPFFQSALGGEKLEHWQAVNIYLPKEN